MNGEKIRIRGMIQETNSEIAKDSKDDGKQLIMSKYNQLWQYIANNENGAFELTFEQIGVIAGVPLDHSFLRYKKELLNYGFKAEKISMKNQLVEFTKLKTENEQ